MFQRDSFKLNSIPAGAGSLELTLLAGCYSAELCCACFASCTRQKLDHQIQSRAEWPADWTIGERFDCNCLSRFVVVAAAAAAAASVDDDEIGTKLCCVHFETAGERLFAGRPTGLSAR